MSSRYDKHTPVIQLDEITTAEENILAELAAIVFQTGDLIYYNGADLVRLAVGSSGQFLKVSGGIPVWSAEAGLGDVVGPVSSTDSAIVLFDGITGKLVKGSTMTTSGSVLSGVTQLATPLTNAAFASGAVLSFNAGDVLITHSANLLTLSGGDLTISGALTATGTTTLATSLTGALRADAGIVSVDTYGTMIHTFKALENIGALDPVIVEQSDLIDRFTQYATNGAMQAVWVSTDVTDIAAQISSGVNPNHAADNPMVLNVIDTVGGTNDYVTKTFSSRNLTGYTVHLVIRHDATVSGDWKFCIASGANLVTDNVKKNITVTAAGVWQHLSFTIASMDADNGSFNITAAVKLGFFCLDATDSAHLYVDKCWFEKSGTTYVGIKRAYGEFSGATTNGGHTAMAVGIAPSAITSGNDGSVALYGVSMAGWSDLIGEYFYYLAQSAPGDVDWNLPASSTKLVSDLDSDGPIIVGQAISDTEMMLVKSTPAPFYAP